MTMLWQCIYRRKPATLSGANELINRYIHFYNHRSYPVKNWRGAAYVAPLRLKFHT